jgi:putative DNA methylase
VTDRSGDGAPRKLIEVALPLQAINEASAREKSIRHGHPSTLHLWWARRPLAACRAVLFAQLVDDPSAHPDRFPTEEAQERERERLFDLITELVQWENSANERILERARAEIRNSIGEDLPPVMDPFAGGGSIPLEAQRLGLRAHAGDLNPVAVMICKALIELPSKFSGRPPVSKSHELSLVGGSWPGARGLAVDVRHYGEWMLERARSQIGHLYPAATLPNGSEAAVIAWLWSRTVICPNPACVGRAPLLRSFVLSSKPEKRVWMRPLSADRHVTFEIVHGDGAPKEGTVSRIGGKCLLCGSPIPLAHIRSEGRAGRLEAQLVAVVAEGQRERIYLPASPEHGRAAVVAQPEGVPRTELAIDPRNVWCVNYGLTRHADLFTPRQLTALTTFSDLVMEARDQVIADGGSEEYANAVATYLSLTVSRIADRHSNVSTWDASPTKKQVRGVFARQAIPMAWDFAEGNPFGNSSGAFKPSINWVSSVLDRLPATPEGKAHQVDATTCPDAATRAIIFTDPPYYDNIGYANLADFFYVWLRRSLGGLYPEIFATLLTPKQQELVADPQRSGGTEAAKSGFEMGFRAAVGNMVRVSDPRVPITIFYAFKQAETDGDDHVASTGWETMLKGLVASGLAVTGTWPMRTELGNRPRGQGSNALASSVVLVCRPRAAGAGIIDRKGLLVDLKATLPERLRVLQQGAIAPVDLAQAAIGPGMEVYSKYERVVEADGTSMPVRAALGVINQVLDQVLAEQEGEFDPDTRWAISWFEQHGFGDGTFGEAETLSKARVTAIGHLGDVGMVDAKGGKVRLRSRLELDCPGSMPEVTSPAWILTQIAAHRLESRGERAAAEVIVASPSSREVIHDLAYRLHAIAQRQGWAEDASCYNALGASWAEIQTLADRIRTNPRQESML